MQNKIKAISHCIPNNFEVEKVWTRNEIIVSKDTLFILKALYENKTLSFKVTDTNSNFITIISNDEIKKVFDNETVKNISFKTRLVSSIKDYMNI